MENTKERIIKAATNVFINKGFSGTSISMIAKAASINQSLIYHHIGNKRNLWIEVKKSLIGNERGYEENYEDFEDFINKIVDARLKIYEKDSRIIRMIQWQALEDQKELVSQGHASPESWIKVIKELQQMGKIKDDVEAALICVCIHSLINGMIYDNFSFFAENNNFKKQYIEIIKRMIINEYGA